MKNRSESSVNNYKEGHNCAQAVACAFCDIAGISRENAFEITKKYGGGRHKLCGAVIAMLLIADALNGNKINENSQCPAQDENPFLKKLSQEFINKHGSLMCCELPKKENGVNKCNDYVKDAAEILAANIKR